MALMHILFHVIWLVPVDLSAINKLISYCRPFRRQMTGLVLNVSFWPELEHKMAFVYARKDDVAVASF